MSRRIAQCTCVTCHSIVPRTEAVQKIYYDRVGFSGPSVGVSYQHMNNPRINSGRSYTRKKTVWVCDDCAPDWVDPNSLGTVGWIIIWAIITGIVMTVIGGLPTAAGIDNFIDKILGVFN